MLSEFRYAFRSLLRQPTFTTVAVLTLVLGIGTNTAIFSVIKAVLLNQLPYEDPSRLVVVAERDHYLAALKQHGIDPGPAPQPPAPAGPPPSSAVTLPGTPESSVLPSGPGAAAVSAAEEDEDESESGGDAVG